MLKGLTKKVTTVVRIVYNGQSYTLTAEDEASSGQCLIFLPYEITGGYSVNEAALKAAKTDGEKLVAYYTLKRFNHAKRIFEYVPLKLADEDFETLTKKLKAEVAKANSKN